ncbi:LPS-assembly protein LptD [Rappaport israeli]|uniref:LPS-assembly protein LptD n=1 Tax=Rappaport israeli TaxID=1839807 RepID=UPI0009307A71|nr:LPS assembly protein LptD [Rappaport israeli]
MLRYQNALAQVMIEEGGLFASPKLVVQGREGRYDLSAQTIDFKQADYLMRTKTHTVIGSAQNVHFDQKQQNSSFEQLTWTTCARQSPAWHLQAQQLTLDQQTQRGVARNITFNIKNIPVLYLPYFSFPTTEARQSGFLTPMLHSSEKRGLDLTLPYYWNIAPNQDATFSLRPMSKRGIMLEGEYRYLGARQSATLNGMWIDKDNKSLQSPRWSFKFDHRAQLNQQWRSELLLQDVSDSHFVEDYDYRPNVYNQWYLERYARLIGEGRYGTLIIQGQDYQRISPKVSASSTPYRRLPQVLYHYAKEHQPFHYALNAEAIRFEAPNKGSANRFDVQGEVGYRLNRSYGYFEPKLRLKATHYDLSNFNATHAKPQQTRLLPTLSLDGGLTLERPLQWGGAHFTQTIEPRLFYLYTPYRNQDDLPLFDTGLASRSWQWLFAPNRFIGGDRIGDANQLTTVLTTRLYKDEDGQEKFRLSLGQIQYFADRKVNLTASAAHTEGKSVIVGEGFYQIDRHWDIYALSFWDTAKGENQRDVIDLRYKLEDDRFISLGHHYYRNRYNQLSLSGVWRINPQWRVFARQDYSKTFDRSLNSLLGVEYNDCCWAWRLVGKHYRDTPQSAKANNAVYLEFVFKGLGNMGNRSAALLSQEIQGFKPLKEE